MIAMRKGENGIEKEKAWNSEQKNSGDQCVIVWVGSSYSFSQQTFTEPSSGPGPGLGTEDPEPRGPTLKELPEGKRVE